MIKGTEAIATVLSGEIIKICVAFSKKKSNKSPTQQTLDIDSENLEDSKMDDKLTDW